MTKEEAPPSTMTKEKAPPSTTNNARARFKISSTTSHEASPVKKSVSVISKQEEEGPSMTGTRDLEEGPLLGSRISNGSSNRLATTKVPTQTLVWGLGREAAPDFWEQLLVCPTHSHSGSSSSSKALPGSAGLVLL